ncbi:MAG: HAMP domain-containing histidine kinase, partial [Blastocatellia bacterium]|nr:HAMP domain-containing histidine kinase [Blastocatellia bacterium]
VSLLKTVISSRAQYRLSLVLVVALLVLLPVLAVLQYVWVGQVSRSERLTMQANLRSGATKFSQDFDREVTRAFLGFQAVGPPDQIWKDYANRYNRWFETTPFPRMVEGVFRVESEKDGKLRFTSFDETTGRFEPRDWPAELANLRRRFEQIIPQIQQLGTLRSQIGQKFTLALPRAGHPDQKGITRLNFLFSNSVEAIDSETPALLIPAHSMRYLDADKGIALDPHLSFIIVTFDLDYIKQEMIPALARRYFADGDALDYKLAIRSRSDSQKIIYLSDPDLSIDSLDSADATVDMFSLSRDEIENLSSENALRSADGSDKLVPADRLAISVLRQARGKDETFTKSLGVEEGQWQLVLKHRAGSLEAVVAGARRRNLFASFGILILLAVSVTMIIVSTRRAAAVAHQQMEFVAGVSHELRTPLAVIRSAGENLADGVIEDRQQVRRYGALIADEGRRLTEMVEQVLEFSGIQSGRKTYELLPVEAGDLIEGALASCESLIAEGGFTIEREIPSGLPSLAADRTAFNRALQNLLSNAMKYSGDSRWIRVKAQKGAGERASEVEITVEDRGLGIAADDLPHIFEPFHRGREATAAQIHGNGLGLSLVKHIITGHGGSVRVTSERGRGSAFTLSLPAFTERDKASGKSIELVKSDA